MLNRFVLAVVVSGLVPVLGLTSCSKDQPEEWALSEPVLVGPGDSVRVSEADHRSFAYNTRLKFKGKPWSSLEVVSNCRLESEVFEQKFSLTYQDSVAIRSLWPNALTSKLNDLQLIGSECDFAFTAINDAGSTHGFELRDVTLDAFVDPSEILFTRRLTEDAARLVSHERDRQLRPISAHHEIPYLTSVVRHLVDQLDGPGDVSLICGNQVATVKASDDFTQTVSDLLSKSALSGQVSCHFLASRHDSETNLFAMSAEALMRFSSLQLNVVARTLLPTIGQPKFQQIEISNPNSENAFISVPAQAPDLKMKYAYILDQTLFMQAQESKTATAVQVSDVNRVGENQYVIPPGGKAVITLLSTPMSAGFCSLSARAGAIGMRWGFGAAFVVQQLESLDAAAGSPIYNAPVITNTFSYPASMIHESYQKDFGPTVPDWVAPATPQQQMQIPRC